MTLVSPQNVHNFYGEPVQNFTLSFEEEIKMSHDKSIWLNQHPQVEAPREMLCFGYNTDEFGVCHAMGGSVIFKEDTIYSRTGLTAIILTETQIKCKTRSGNPCALTFTLNNGGNATYFKMLDHSMIHGSEVFFESPSTQLTIDGTSEIEVNGRSSNSKGTVPDQGGTYLGEGGSCGSNETYQHVFYGQFFMQPDPQNIYANPHDSMMGSMGTIGDLNTQGGGHIHINVDSFNFTSKADEPALQIQANGIPLKSSKTTRNLNGGSGGYVYINTTNQFQENYLSSRSTIQALGGHGKNKGYGGAGGVIVLGAKVRTGVFNVRAEGGLGGEYYQNTLPLGCASAASGTAYFWALDLMLVHNWGQVTDKYTQFSATTRHPDYPGQYVLSEYLYVGQGTNINIKNSGIDSILFPTLEMYGNTKMKFDIDNVDVFTLKFRNHFAVDKTNQIDFTKIRKEVRVESISDFTDYNLVALGQTTFSQKLVINSTYIDIAEKIEDPNPDRAAVSSVQLYGKDIWLEEDADIQASSVFIYASGSLKMSDGVRIKSKVENECTTDPTGNKDLYQCIPTDYQDDSLTDLRLYDYFNLQYGLHPSDTDYARTPEQLHDKIMSKWNVYILAMDNIHANYSAQIKAPRIGMCSNYINLVDTYVSANGRGCRAGTGLGAGIQEGYCAGSGASHGGVGGYGGSESNEATEKAICLKSYPEPYYFGQEARYEGSGGANGEVRQTVETGGAGGGIVWLTSPKTISLQNSTSIEARGMWGNKNNFDQFGAGGGSGGSVQITTLNLRGDARVSVKGGAGSPGGGGGGSGGRLVMNYLKSYLASSQPEQSFYWTGTHDISGGTKGDMSFHFQGPSDGQNGTMFHSKCFPGYSGVFCKACLVGEYKYDYSFGKCMPCQNRPENSFYTTIGERSSICAYQCNVLLENVDNNPDCLDPISLEVQRLGGVIPFFGLLGIFLLLSLLVFSMLSYRSQTILENMKELRETLYETWENADETQRGAVSEEDFSLKDQNIWCHTHRMYIIGSNTIRYPWFIPKDFPRDALKKQDREKLIKFIDEHNQQLKFRVWEKMIFCIVKLVYPPFAKLVHFYLRKQKFTALNNSLFRFFPPQFWSDKGDNRTFRLSCSKDDYQLAYIDFLDFKKNSKNWLGLKLPMPILLAGAGTYNSPYKLDFQEDTLAKSIALIKFDFFRDKLPIFLENFNSQLNKLNFFKLEMQVLRDLQNVVEWLEDSNRAMFNHFDVKCVLYVVENQYSEIEGGVFKQKRRSFPLETIFFEAFPEMYLALLRYIKAKLISHKSEMKLALVFKRYTKQKQIKTEMRVNMMMENDSRHAYKTAINREESVLFDETDQDNEEEKVTYANRPSTRGESVSSEVEMHNDSKGKTKSVKLVDKTRRAFSISIESSKAFELAIRKPRRKLKHSITRIRTHLYGIYLLLVKHHGKPPTRTNLTPYFVAFAVLLSLDIMLLINYTFHLFLPVTNLHEFGWAFTCLYFMVPYLSPITAVAASISGNPYLLKQVGNLNALMICVNIPLTLVFSFQANDDPQFLLILFLMVWMKVALSGASAKVCQNLINPRYAKNQEKLKKILKRQREKMQKREDILGKEANNQIQGIGVNSEDDGSTLDIDTDRLRDKLLE